MFGSAASGAQAQPNNNAAAVATINKDAKKTIIIGGLMTNGDKSGSMPLFEDEGYKTFVFDYFLTKIPE